MKFDEKATRAASVAAEMPDVETELQKLETAKKQLLDMRLAIAKAYGGAFYGLDFLAYAVLKRSLAIIAVFSTLLRARNFVCAAALVRLHLDTLMRFAAGTLVDDPHKFARAVLKGEHVRKLRDNKGNLMTDQYLVSCLSGQNPWIRRVYDATSGYVHLSSKHIFSALNLRDPRRGFGELAISSEDEFVQMPCE